MDTTKKGNSITRKKYIEREAAVMKIREWFWSAPGVHPKLDRDAAEEILFAIPAADVVPVRHGIITQDNACSICGCYIPTDDEHDAIFRNEVHFCYYCGAKLDGKGGDGNV